MRLLRMTPLRWIIVVVGDALALAALTFLKRLAAVKVAAALQEARDQAGVPDDVPLSDIDLPVTHDMMRWIVFDEFLNRFWIVLLGLIVLAVWIATAFLPGRSAKTEVAGAPER